MRWPATSISQSDSRTRVFPETNSLSRWEVAAERSPGSTFSFATAPEAVRASSVARSSRHSSFPSHNGLGGSSGRGAARSKRHAFWLLDPELSTRIFILIRPFPIANFRHVVAIFADILFMFNEFVAQLLFKMRVHGAQSSDTIRNIAGKMEAIQLIEHRHIERSCGGALFAVAVHMKARVVRAFIGEAVN